MARRMSMKSENILPPPPPPEGATPASTIKQQCFQCIKGPANILMTLVVILCFVASCVQVGQCVRKIFKPPVTTYTHFDFNNTLWYPAVTFCREPPYKFNELANYGLYAHPQWTSMWANFDFESVSLDELWNRTTYSEEEYFVQLGLDEEKHNLDIIPTLGFDYGRCYTIRPRIVMSTASKDTGYSVLLRHSAEDVGTSMSLYPPGYHVYIHSNKEPYTEVAVPGIGLVDYLYVNIGEEIDIKLTVNEYDMISKDSSPCNRDEHHSASICTTSNMWRDLGDNVGCSGPWMKSDLPYCSNYTTMRALISNYMSSYKQYGTSVYPKCPRRCKANFYQAYVTNRKSTTHWDHATNTWIYRTGEASYQTQIYMHYNSMMVSVYEERHNYDWSLFLADLGGSVGFLLGLSVIGAMKIAGKVWKMLLKPVILPPKPNKCCEERTDSYCQPVPKLMISADYMNKHTY